MSKNFVIKVEMDAPPIPDRSVDWTAWIDGREESSTCYGPTASAVLFSLAEQLETEEA